MPRDCIVIGAGIVGASVAWHLARLGQRVTVVDKIGVGSGMTGIQPGGVREQWSSPALRGFAAKSKAFYKDLGQNLGVPADPGFRPCGYAFVASSPETAGALQQDVRSQLDEGLNVRWMDAEGALAIWPYLNPDAVHGVAFGPDDGYLDHPGVPVAAFANAAENLGVSFEVAEVVGLGRDPERPAVLLADGTVIQAETVVIAAGFASKALAATGGVDLPLRKDQKILFYSQPIETRLVDPLFVLQDEGFAVKQLADGSVLASDLALRHVDAGRELEMARTVEARARSLIPLLEHVRLRTVVRGHYDATPDAQCLLGRLSPGSDYWIAAGMNGRGMMIAPAVGQVMARSIAEGSEEEVPPEMLRARWSQGIGPTSAESRVI